MIIYGQFFSILQTSNFQRGHAQAPPKHTTGSYSEWSPISFAYVLTRPPTVRYRVNALSFLPATYSLRFRHSLPSHYRGPTLANWIHNAATSSFSMNSLLCCCFKPTAHCNKSRDSVDLLEKLRFRRKLRQALQRLAN